MILHRSSKFITFSFSLIGNMRAFEKLTEPTFLIQFIIRFINIAEFIDYLACSFILKQNKNGKYKKLSKI